MQKRIFILLLAACLTSSSLVACSNTSEEETTLDTTPSQEETIETETEITDDLPEGLRFSGESYTILSRDENNWIHEMCTDELTGETVNDAVYNREIATEDRLNVAIDAHKTPGMGDNTTALFNKIRSAVQAGDSSYQLVAGYAFYVPALATEGLFTNLLDVPYLNFDKPWWNSNLRDELTLYDQLYFAGGDLSYTMIANMFCCYFNKDLATDYGVEDLYSVVQEGRWTYDYMYTLITSIGQDVDGNGIMDENDAYGLTLTVGNVCDTFFAAYDQPVTARDENGDIVLRLGDDKAIDIAEKMMSFYNATDHVYSPSESDDTRNIPFLNGRALINVVTMSFAVKYLRDVDFSYGILPLAKYDEKQENYQTLSQDAYSLFCIPLNAGDLEMIGAVTEVMAYESWKNVTPAYFEVAMKSKYSRDEASSQMLDLIRDGAMFNFGFVNASSCNTMMHILRNVATGSKGYASILATKEKSYQTGLDKLVQAYKDMQP